MGFNPCCCWKLKDAAVTIGIWSAIFALCQLGIYGWQMAAIKYERDRAANTLLPNYNTYGRYDVPSYYESYWQSPEERFYTALFVIQVLCMIVSFFLLFASCALIYGVHTWSRILVWPWIAIMIASVLSSTAYCICWWTGDVRDYWLVLTILEIFGVFINTYFIVVICIFYSRMQRELEYYEGKRRNKYDRFSPLDSTQTLEPEPAAEGYRNQWDDDRWHPHDPYLDNRAGPYPPQYLTPVRRYDDQIALEPVQQTVLEPTLQHAQSVPSFFDDSFRDVPRGHHHHRRSHSRHRSCSCKKKRKHSHHHHGRSRSKCRNKSCDCSEVASSDFSSVGLSESTDSRCHHKHKHGSDDDSDSSSHHCRRRSKSRNSKRGPRQVKRDDRQREYRHSSTQADPEEPVHALGNPSQGITIPQHIVIPPTTDDADGNPRKYHINSEITISYDPKKQENNLVASPRPGTSLGRQPVSITSNV